MKRKISIYGRGDIKSVEVTKEMELDFEKSYGVKFIDEANGKFSQKRKFDMELEKLRYERDVVTPIEQEKMGRNPEMYPPKGLR